MRRLSYFIRLILLLGGCARWPMNVQALMSPSLFSMSKEQYHYTEKPPIGKKGCEICRLASLYSNRGSTDTSCHSTANQPKNSAVKNSIQDEVVEGKGMPKSIWGSYMQFARSEPFANNIIIATSKTATADFVAQTLVSHTPLGEFDVQRSLLFGLYGALYLGTFQYIYQVNIFNRLFDVERFTSESVAEKLQNKDGIQAMALQVALDQTVVALIALPVFYTFQASIFSGSLDPSDWLNQGYCTWKNNFLQDQTRIMRVWIPANILCFSVPLYLRLPARHAISFVWTTYFSFLRGGG